MTLEVLERAVGGGGKRERVEDGNKGAPAGGDGEGKKRRGAKYPVMTTITGLGRTHLGPAGDSNARQRELLLDALETYLVMGRVLQDRCAAAMYTWNAVHWEDGFSDFDSALFHNTFWTKERAQAFGMGLLAAARLPARTPLPTRRTASCRT